MRPVLYYSVPLIQFVGVSARAERVFGESMRLLILINNYAESPIFSVFNRYVAEYTRAFPGSCVYGPGYEGYVTNDVPDILSQLGGEDKFDAVLCYSFERPLLNEPIPEIITKTNRHIPCSRWFFPKNLHKVRLPKILVPLDFWHCTAKEWSRVLLGNGFDYFCQSYSPPFLSDAVFEHFFTAEVRERVAFIPVAGATDTKKFMDFGFEKQFDVIMAGAQQSDFYPVRFKMLQEFRKSDLELFEPPHPGYKNAKTHNPYPRFLNTSKISAFCNGRFHVQMGKLFEAMVSRCAPLCDFFYGAEYLGMVPDEHFIPATGENCVARAKEYLIEPDRLTAMYDAGQKLILERHTVEKRVDEFAEMFPALINEGKALHWAELSPNLKTVHANRQGRTRFAVNDDLASTRHVLDETLKCDKSTWQYWHRLGAFRMPGASECSLGLYTQEFYMRELASSWVAIFKADYLKKLAIDNGAVVFLETGTGMGFQAFVWAGMLLEQGKRGRIITMDALGHETEVCLHNAAFVGREVSRKRLWEEQPETEYIRFLPRNNQPLSRLPKADIVHIAQCDTYESTMADFALLYPFMLPKTILAVNNYNPDNPGVMDAVHELANTYAMNIEHVVFEPEPEGLAVCRFKA